MPNWMLPSHWFQKTRDFFKWVIKCAHYSRLLWNDRDWDFCFILLLLSFKLQRVRKCIVKNSIIEATKRVEKQIKYAEFLIEKCLNDVDADEKREMHKEKWGAVQYTHGEYQKIGAITVRPIIFSYPKCKTGEEELKAHEEMKAIFAWEAEKHSEYLDRLFKHLRKYLENWWD